jgi:8-oxo-dGTP diphosphatase
MKVDWSEWRPTEIAVLCFIFQKNEVLLIEKLRGLGAGKVNGPGGRIEAGESPEQAAIRELQEEIAVTPIQLSRLGNLRFAFTNRYFLECWVFRAEGYTGAPSNSSEAIPFWNSIETVPYERMWEDDRHWFPHLVKGQPFQGQFIFDGDRMLHCEVSQSKLVVPA